MTEAVPTFQPSIEAPTLDNCASEPIHIPGAVQPHGALLAFDFERRVTHYSANVHELLGFTPLLGMPLLAEHFADAPLSTAVANR